MIKLMSYKFAAMKWDYKKIKHFNLQELLDIPIILNAKFQALRMIGFRVRSLVVRDLNTETKSSRFKSDCYLCAEVSSLQ